MDAIWKRYRQSSKAAKKQILDEICAATGYHRKYAIRKIRGIEECEKPKPAAQRREPIYEPEVLRVIEKIWEEAGYPWSVRMKAILHLWLPSIRRRFPMSAITRAQLFRISPRTIDRALASKKQELRRRLYGRTKPGTLLRHQIPTKCKHWDVDSAGNLELDTVSHCGSNGELLFVYSPNLTDIGPSWGKTSRESSMCFPG